MALQIHGGLCFLMVLFLHALPYFIVSQSNHNITLGESLTASGDNSSWASPSGDFAFGFQGVDTSGFLLAIWFDKIPEKTIVWSANRDNLAPRGSKVALTSTGMLVLNNPQGQQIWRAAFTENEVAYAAMLDNGNFILADQGSVTKWGTFDVPTDTILPTQILNLGSRLTSCLTENNCSSGRFQLRMRRDRNLVLYPLAFPTDSVKDAYWASNTVGNGSQVVFNESGNIYLEQTNGILFKLFQDINAPPTSDFYRRATLDYDGVFRYYERSKTGRQQSWSIRSFFPSNICLAVVGDFGSGACGYNSYCRLDNNKKPFCECPPGYTYMDENLKFKGCKQNFVSQSCDNGEDASEFDFAELSSTNWPNGDDQLFQLVTEEWCKQFCLKDCFCSLAIFTRTTGNCWLKRFPFSNGMMDSSIEAQALIKLRKGSNVSSQSPFPGTNTKKKHHSGIFNLTGSLLLGASWFLTFLLVLALLAKITFWSCYKKKLHNLHPEGMTTTGVSLRSFTYEELEKATTSFKEKLGSGAFATVYKGILASNDQKLVAVKRLDKLSDPEKEFKTELHAIGRTCHKNLVQLLGFCNEGPHWLLVYEFMSNGSLSSYLFQGQRPNWHQRMQIALGIGRGLMYLHEECSTQIIHCDIKPQNILLDDAFTARISDFGLAKLLNIDQSRSSTGIRGTKGYVAPEWFKGMAINTKVDVYSFGVVLLEIICCRHNIEPNLEDEAKVILTDWAFDCYKERTLGMLVESDKEAMDDMKSVLKQVMIAIWCIQEEPALRPTMKNVVQMMEGTAQVYAPPNPAVTSSIV